MVKLFFPTKDAIGFESVEKPTNGKPEHIVSLLVDIGALPANVAILSFTINGKKAHADMNAVYGSTLKSTGTTGERYLVSVFETDHATIDGPIKFWDGY